MSREEVVLKEAVLGIELGFISKLISMLSVIVVILTMTAAICKVQVFISLATGYMFFLGTVMVLRMFMVMSKCTSGADFELLICTAAMIIAMIPVTYNSHGIVLWSVEIISKMPDGFKGFFLEIWNFVMNFIQYGLFGS